MIRSVVRNSTTWVVLRIQLQLMLTGFIGFGLYSGREAALAAAYCSFIHVVTTFLMQWRLFPPYKTLSTEQFYRQLFRAELQKMALAFVMVWAGAAVFSLMLVPMVILFIVTGFAYWLALRVKPAHD